MPGSSHSLRPSRSVRARILVWVLLMAALGLAVTGGTLLAVQSSRLDAAADRALQREYAEFARQAAGVDPATGEPFTEVRHLLVTALQYRVPGPFQTIFTMVDGEPYVFSGGERPVALEDEPAALAAIRSVPADGGVAVLDVPTSVGPVRIAVVPVAVEGSTATGSYVVAHAAGLERQGLTNLALLYLGLSALSLLVIGLVGWQVSGELVRPLNLLRAATARTNATDLGARIPVTGRDEIAELTLNYNAMLDRLQDSFEAQRQLVDDVGHELRTPVTIVRGYLELLDPDDPAAVSETRALLLDETDRMGRLVGDLITLAKTGRPDFVTPAAVELEELTVECFDKARALGDRRWILERVADAQVVLDAQRLTQAWLQLAENAAKYSAPGSVVALGSAVDGGEVRLWVRDEGVGIPTEELGRIFERFGRSESARGAEGSGLGLTIARAIVEAHGGRVEVVSLPGEGSTFTLVVPTAVPAVEADQSRVAVLAGEEQ